MEARTVAAGYKAASKEPNQSGRPPAGRLRGQVDESSTIRRDRDPPAYYDVLRRTMTYYDVLRRTTTYYD
eukprot:11527832-Alexandrium_andersonii.AAC.1